MKYQIFDTIHQTQIKKNFNLSKMTKNFPFFSIKYYYLIHQRPNLKKKKKKLK